MALSEGGDFITNFAYEEQIVAEPYNCHEFKPDVSAVFFVKVSKIL